MKLKPAPKPDIPHEVKIRLEAPVYRDLEAYSELYQAEYDEPIDVPKLAAEILRQFVQNDRAFRSWKRRRDREERRARPCDGPEAPAAGEPARA